MLNTIEGAAVAMSLNGIVDGSDSKYGMVFWNDSTPKVLGNPSYICLTPTFSSMDGEYRNGFIQYDVFDEMYEKHADIFSPIERRIADLLGDNEPPYRVLPEDITDKVKIVMEQSNLARRALAVAAYLYATMPRNVHQKSDLLETLLKLSEGAVQIKDSVRCLRNILLTGDKRIPLGCGQKIIPLTYNEVVHFGDPTHSAWREMFIDELASDLFINLVAPNFATFISWGYINGSGPELFENKSMKKRFERDIAARAAVISIKEARKHLEPVLDNTADYTLRNTERSLYNIVDAIHNDLIMSKYALMNIKTHIGVTIANFAEYVYRFELGSYPSTIEKSLSVNYTKYIFDICYACVCLHTNCGVVHGDLHLNNMTINLQPHGMVEHAGALPENSYMLYVTADDTERNTFIVPYANRTFGCVIDFSRSFLAGPKATEQLKRTGRDALSSLEAVYEKQTPVIMKTFKRFLPKIVEENERALYDAVVTDAYGALKILSAADIYSATRNAGLMLRDEYARVSDMKPDARRNKITLDLAVAKELIKKSEVAYRMMLRATLAFIRGEGAPDRCLSIDVLPPMFPEFLYSSKTKTELDEMRLFALFNALSPITYSSTIYDSFPPWAQPVCVGKSMKKINETIGSYFNVPDATPKQLSDYVDHQFESDDLVEARQTHMLSIENTQPTHVSSLS
jgi:hypothetical protein